MRLRPSISSGIRSSLGVFLAALILWATPPAEAQQTARAHIGFGADHPLSQGGWRAFLARLKAEKRAPALSLFLNGPPPDDPAAIQNLARDDYAFGAAALPAFRDAFPYAALLSELGLAGGEDELAAAAAATELFMIECGACRQAFQAQQVVFLGAYGAARYVLLSRGPIATPGDFRGLAALTPGGAWDRLVISLGGVAREEYGDAGDLFVKGHITAAIATPMELSDPDVWRHVRFALLAPLGAYRGGAAFMASGKYWRSLSPDARRAVFNAAADGLVGVMWGYQNMSDAALRAAAARGLNVATAGPALSDAMRLSIAADSQRVAETASQRFGVSDAAAFLDRFLFLYDKFAVLLSGAKDAASAADVLRREIYDRVDVNQYGGETGG